MTEQDTDKRLERIEQKVDKLVDTIATLARMDEKILMQQQGMSRMGARLDDLEFRLEVIEKKMPLINLLLNGFGKVGITVLSLIILGIVGSFFVFK